MKDILLSRGARGHPSSSPFIYGIKVCVLSRGSEGKSGLYLLFFMKLKSFCCRKGARGHPSSSPFIYGIKVFCCRKGARGQPSSSPFIYRIKVFLLSRGCEGTPLRGRGKNKNSEKSGRSPFPYGVFPRAPFPHLPFPLARFFALLE